MKSPEEIISAFERAVSLFLDFRMKRLDPNLALVIEAEIRLEQALFLLRRFRELEIDWRVKNRAPAPDGPAEPVARATELDSIDIAKLHGEAFYYFAWRARQAMEPLPGLSFESVGVREVRNRLIEHPDKGNGFLVSGYTFDCPEGLLLTPWGSGVGGPVDPGLYPNAQEFIDNLLPKIEKALEHT